MSITCPECQSARLHWSLHRNKALAVHATERHLVWTCRACGHTWSDSLTDPHPETDAPLPAMDG